ncbi:MAG: AsmA family protein [Gammaproteobacteria bacterium]|nr:AsmA family protein [Gammaproteobacteria bacterium]MBT8057901.1 AsmA family protein [Gammaproteobacteria bacterium]NNJ78407.1 AsmA family protein [Xanthomonadales bacterium]
MRRLLILFFASLLILLVVVTGLVFWAINHDTFLKDQLAGIVQERTGRELTVDGPLEIRLGRQTTIEASQIALENAPWGENEAMLRVGHVQLAIDVPSLFENRAQLDSLVVQDCRIEMRSNEQGESNWDILPPADEQVASDQPGRAVSLLDLAVTRCELTIDGPRFEQEVNLGIALARLKPAPGDRLEGLIKGRVNEDELEFDGWLSPLGALTEGGKLEHQVNLTLGSVTLESSGSVADTTTWSGPDISTRFSGPEISKVLARLGLPAFSEGAFDFRAKLSNEGDLSRLDVDGGLGKLYIDAVGSFDRLKAPSRGHLRANATGPDLAALGGAFGVPNLVASSFEARLALRFDGPSLVVEQAGVSTDNDRLDLSGMISMEQEWAGSSLDIELRSDRIDPWLAPHAEMAGPVGAVSLTGNVAVDATGQLSIDARGQTLDTEVSAKGSLGTLAGGLTPDLEIGLRTEHPPVAGAAFGVQKLPDAPLNVKGALRLDENRLVTDGMDIRLGPHSARVSGAVPIGGGVEGSQADVSLDIPDLAALGQLFDIRDLPAAPLRLDGEVATEGKGLRFLVRRGEAGALRLHLDGRIADLDVPLGIDLEYDIGLPGLSVLDRWLPDLAWPDGEVTARGRLEHQQDRVNIAETIVTLAGDEARLEGDVYLEDKPRLDVLLITKLPDLARWEELAGRPLPGIPVDLTTRVAGNAEALSFHQLDFRAGVSQLKGDIAVVQGETLRISAELTSPRLDLDTWVIREEAPAEAQPKGEPRRFLLDDTEIPSLGELGVEIDLDLSVAHVNLPNTHYSDVSIALLLQDGRLEIEPFGLKGSGGGRFDGMLRFDERGDLPMLELDLNADNMPFLAGAREGQDPATLPHANLVLSLRSAGQTHRELAESLGGRMRLNVGPGQLASSNYSFLVNDFVAELLNTLNPFAKSEEFTSLDCAVIAADVASGQVTLDPIILHLERLTVISKGLIDLDSEQLDLTFNSKQRKGLGISASDLVKPFIKVGGTLASPSIELDPSGGGLAVATLGLSILADSLVGRYLSSKDPCGDALQRLEKRDSGTP